MSISDTYGQERLSVFLLSLENGGGSELSALGEQAREQGIPVIRRESEVFLKFLLSLKKPEKILEIGCAVGYSALLMREHGLLGGHKMEITTIERNPEMIAKARQNLRRFDPDQRITLLEGDAQDILGQITGPFDMVFMDAAKGQYIHFLPRVVQLLSPGGLLLSDNVLQEGDILESHYAVERRNRTIYHRMRQYLRILHCLDGAQSVVVPLGDGMMATIVQDPQAALLDLQERLHPLPEAPSEDVLTDRQGAAQ